MAGLTPQSPRPTEIKLHQKSRELEVAFDDNRQFRFSCEYLRVYSPSAEVRGHGPGQEVLQIGKKNVQISAIEPVGTYAVTLVFSDGHNTGIYSWDYLHDLGVKQDEYWKTYLARMQAPPLPASERITHHAHRRPGFFRYLPRCIQSAGWPRGVGAL
ncbi:MAG: DUF971 domain-containing protein [Betaproteobacteria bacterium]|nr:DUF971 domain-containing protein [Betaproteobacteria bacterium]